MKSKKSACVSSYLRDKNAIYLRLSYGRTLNCTGSCVRFL